MTTPTFQGEAVLESVSSCLKEVKKQLEIGMISECILKTQVSPCLNLTNINQFLQLSILCHFGFLICGVEHSVNKWMEDEIIFLHPFKIIIEFCHGNGLQSRLNLYLYISKC